MGRGRAKAKQTKVARQLKYTNHDIDLERLREELGADSTREEARQADSAHDQTTSA
ncbi:DUF3073 domain-containing protein [Nonomuraea sp. NPDC046570]|uniref:DUF3073 domain-containing protein n=1 Tax=Nonomuraea sp. NPDC046570 TaxID=3155255 RepID=UPI0033C2D222